MKRTLKVLLTVSLICGIALLNGCKKKPDPPTLTTAAVTEITVSTATSGGNVTADGGAEVTAKGVCWGTATKPVITGSKTTDGTGTGAFVSSLTGLTPNTMYYVRAYATNSEGTAYGNELSFTTSQIVVATLTTTAASAILSTTATAGGNISANGGGDITARGVCWSTSADPTTADNKTSDATGTGIFTSSITGLLPGTLYHIRAYATNVAGTAYGNDLTFTTLAVVPTLTTTAASAITTTTAASGGNVTANGGSAVTARGVCWSTATGPVATGSHTSDGTGTGSFTSSLTSLAANTTYYVRAYATNSIGTGYGNEISFKTGQIVVATLTTTAATAITSTTATSGGNITLDGGGNVTARGVCWGAAANPVIGTANQTSNGTGTGTFTSSITGLLPGTTYHVRAFATNSAGTAYGNDITVTTLAVVPTVTTTGVTNITRTTASSGGNITANGGAAVTARGVCWGTTSGPLATGSHSTDGNGSGTFTSSITGLTAGTRYYVRAYATNSIGTAYGNEQTFISGSVVVPTLTTVAASLVTTTTAVSGGNISEDGGGNVTARGVCWSTSTNPTTASSFTSNGTGTGSFTSNLTGLTDNTTYYVRAYATNSAGTAYGNQQTFKTASLTGTVTDVDGNTYNTVKIGTQWWMAQNLMTTKYKNNTDIPSVTDNTLWMGLTTPGFCWYQNDRATFGNTYGALYNWYAINTGNLCPTGWHVPTDNEFKTMEMYLGMSQAQADAASWRGTDEGAKLKTVTGWSVGGTGTNEVGFSALPGGYRYYGDGSFNELNSMGSFGTSTEWSPNTTYIYRQVRFDLSTINRMNANKQAGFSVRCVQD